MDTLFDVGQVEVSELAATAIQASGASLGKLLQKHQSGDWRAEGEVAQKHKEFAAQHGILRNSPSLNRIKLVAPPNYSPV